MSDLLSRSEVMQAVHDACQPDDDDGAVIAATRRDTIRRVQEALERLSGRVRVKPLEFCYGDAHCCLGVYKIDSGRDGNGGRQWAWALNPPDDPFFMWQHAEKADSEAEAEAAAQADFEARILAVLNPAPTPDAREKALREAAAKATEYGAVCAAAAILALIPTGGGDD